jgi:transcription elongation factor GreA
MEALDLRKKIAEAASTSLAEDSPEPFQPLDDLLDAVEETRQLQGLADIAGEALSVQPVDPARYYLRGFALVRLGKTEDAMKVLVSLCGKLEQDSRWDLLSVLLPKGIEVVPSVEAARCLAKLGETAGLDRLDREALEKAYDLYPDEERLAYLMGERAAADGRMEEAVGYWAESLDGFAQLKRYDRLEETILRIADSSRPEHQRHIVSVLHRLADQNQWRRFGSFYELSLPGIRGAGLLVDLWKLLLHLFPKAPEEAGLRKLIRDLAPDAFPSAEGIIDLLGRSGILDSQIKTETSIKQLETLLEFAPGYRVLHASWGIGRVGLNDGDTIIVDFKDTKNHRMKLTLARRALTVLPPDDLRVVQSEEPDELKRLIREDPGEVVVRALLMLNGEATAQELRRNLTGHGIIATGSWTSWWKEARAALETNERCDLSQSFRQVYRLRGGEENQDDKLVLPVIEPRRGIRPNINLIRRFLEQHPDETAHASRLYTPILERWARAENTSAEDRLAVHLHLYRWRREVRPDFLSALEACLEARVEMSSYADESDQALLAKAALETQNLWKKGILFVLSSRSATIREGARERMRRDPDESRVILNELMHDPSTRPLAALSVIDLALEETPEPFTPDPWLVALGAALLIDTASKEPIRKQALALLSQNGPLAGKVREAEAPDGNADRWLVVLRRWHTSERYLQPILNFLKSVHHEELVNEIRSAHAERTDRILGAQAASSAIDYRGHVMTKATYIKLTHERNHLAWELKNTIPKAIQKAREFGDLSENAEYDAAKLKQADTARLVTDLSMRLAEAKLIENLPIPDDEIAPGTEVQVEDVVTRDKRALWVLGEGDDWLGANVISYAAPLGRSLIGKRLGERVSVVGSDQVHELLIRGITRKFPPPEVIAAADAKPAEEVSEVEIKEIVEEIGKEGSGRTGGGAA